MARPARPVQNPALDSVDVGGWFTPPLHRIVTHFPPYKNTPPLSLNLFFHGCLQ